MVFTQPEITCSTSKIEILEQGVKYVESYQYSHYNDTNVVVFVSLLLTLNIFHTLL